MRRDPMLIRTSICRNHSSSDVVNGKGLRALEKRRIFYFHQIREGEGGLVFLFIFLFLCFVMGLHSCLREKPRVTKKGQCREEEGVIDELYDLAYDFDRRINH